MKTNFYPIRHFDAASSAALGAAGPIGIGLSAAQTALGLVQAISGDAKMKKLLAQRKAYVTPQEIYDILNATASRASSGYDPQTLNYLTGETDRALGATLNTAELLGGDPNDLSAIFDKKIQASMKIGAENQLLNMQNFQRYLQAESVVADNKAAEFKSQQDILKDSIQAAAANKQAGLQNIGSGVNAGLATASAYGTAGLYNEKTPATPNYTSTLTPDYYVDVYKKLLENQNKSVNQSGYLIRGGG
jgi:hypothetical protein